MEGKLVKVNDEFYSLYDSDGDIIASNNPKTPTTKKLSLKNCQAIENGYDLDELANTTYKEFPTDPMKMYNRDTQCFKKRKAYINGFKKALELIGDKKFSEDDIRKAIEFDKYHYEYGNITAGKRDDEKEEFIQSLQQSEFDVEIVFDKDCYSSNGRCDKSEMANCIICTPVTYLKDADGCLILKRI